MGWFNHSKKFAIHKLVVSDTEYEYVKYYTDYEKILEGDKFLEDAKINKGKYVTVFDEGSFRELTPKEIQEIEDNIPVLTPTAYIPISYKGESIKLIPTSVDKKYRNTIPNRLRDEIHERDDNKCQICGTSNDLQIHHIDQNPANNDLSNLASICYRCHKNIHKQNSKKHKNNKKLF